MSTSDSARRVDDAATARCSGRVCDPVQVHHRHVGQLPGRQHAGVDAGVLALRRGSPARSPPRRRGDRISRVRTRWSRMACFIALEHVLPGDRHTVGAETDGAPARRRSWSLATPQPMYSLETGLYDTPVRVGTDLLDLRVVEPDAVRQRGVAVRAGLRRRAKPPAGCRRPPSRPRGRCSPRSSACAIRLRTRRAISTESRNRSCPT